MADDFSFQLDFNGIDEDLQKVVNEYPDETNKFMLREARRWKKDCNDKGYGKYTGGKRSIPKSWKNVKEENILHQVTEIQIQNQAPHFHLVENGHVKWLFGRNTGGYVAGKHWAEKTRAEWREKFGGHVAEYLDKMLRGHDL